MSGVKKAQLLQETSARSPPSAAWIHCVSMDLFPPQKTPNMGLCQSPQQTGRSPLIWNSHSFRNQGRTAGLHRLQLLKYSNAIQFTVVWILRKKLILCKRIAGSYMIWVGLWVAAGDISFIWANISILVKKGKICILKNKKAFHRHPFCLFVSLFLICVKMCRKTIPEHIFSYTNGQVQNLWSFYDIFI